MEVSVCAVLKSLENNVSSSNDSEGIYTNARLSCYCWKLVYFLIFIFPKLSLTIKA